MKPTTQSGFTLIELMIVVAIVDILAALAIPAYQAHTTRSQAIEAIVLLGGASDTIDEFVSQTGRFPDSTTALTGLGIRTSGKFVSSLSVTNSTGPLGTLTATFNNSSVSTHLTGRTVQMEREADKRWRCLAGGADAVDLKYMPRTCQ